MRLLELIHQHFKDFGLLKEILPAAQHWKAAVELEAMLRVSDHRIGPVFVRGRLSSRPDHDDYPLRSVAGVFVLPSPDRDPTRRFEQRVGLAVTFTVSAYLFCPI
jgi:hypothetical protein